jgi:hypothetical protein
VPRAASEQILPGGFEKEARAQEVRGLVSTERIHFSADCASTALSRVTSVSVPRSPSLSYTISSAPMPDSSPVSLCSRLRSM